MSAGANTVVMSDRVLWAVIVKRLEDERAWICATSRSGGRRRGDLERYACHKADRRRIEDVADIDGVRHVQNNLRVHDRSHWTFL